MKYLRKIYTLSPLLICEFLVESFIVILSEVHLQIVIKIINILI